MIKIKKIKRLFVFSQAYGVFVSWLVKSVISQLDALDINFDTDSHGSQRMNFNTLWWSP